MLLLHLNQQNQLKSSLKGLNKSNNTHELGYGLAVAQALGIKIERVYDREAFDEMAKLLSNPVISLIRWLV